MGLEMSSFGAAIASARKAKSMSQKELATRINKEDGQSITPQYLNDIEHDRRSPTSDHMIGQFAKVLAIPEGVLYVLSGVLPDEHKKLVPNSTPEKVDAAFMAFRTALKR